MPSSPPPSAPPRLPNASYVLAVHGGVGGRRSHSSSRAATALLERALRKVSRALPWDADACEVVTAAVAALEDEPQTNAGLGASLTVDGRAECDACVATTGSAGAVGAVEGVRNPVRLADCVRTAAARPGVLGLVPPLFLAGAGAAEFARDQCGLTVCSDCHLTDDTRRAHEEYTMRVNLAVADLSAPAASNASGWLDMNGRPSDTVGAVCFDVAGRAASASSSGGNWLKLPGRIGAAAVPGAAVSVQDQVAVAGSGNGELMIQSSFALQCALQLQRTSTHCSDNDDCDDRLRRLVIDCESGFIAAQRWSDGRIFVQVMHPPHLSINVGWVAPASMRRPVVEMSHCAIKGKLTATVISSGHVIKARL
jgi:taspase, threonine aspartase, 1